MGQNRESSYHVGNILPEMTILHLRALACAPKIARSTSYQGLLSATCNMVQRYFSEYLSVTFNVAQFAHAQAENPRTQNHCMVLPGRIPAVSSIYARLLAGMTHVTLPSDKMSLPIGSNGSNGIRGWLSAVHRTRPIGVSCLATSGAGAV